jgi:hypothetical protein
MTSTTLQKTLCATCGKTTGLFMCRGCGKDFCMRHTNEHQQELGKQMDELTLDHDQFRQKLIEQKTHSQYYSHIKQKIDTWEHQSINKIRQAANDARKDLENKIEEYSTKLTEDLTKIADELKQARREEEFLETNILEWTNQLNKLKNDLAKPPAFDIQQDQNEDSFISKIYIDVSLNEVFERILGNIRLEDNKQVIVHGESNSYATVRGKGEYFYGQHRLRLQIQECFSSKWIFIGIISKDVIITENSSVSPSVYGWAEPNQVYINGVYNQNLKNYRSEVQKNDILELLIDCDERKIHLTNERTHSSDELDINLNKCPFPWQLNVIMYFAGDRIRFLST